MRACSSEFVFSDAFQRELNHRDAEMGNSLEEGALALLGTGAGKREGIGLGLFFDTVDKRLCIEGDWRWKLGRCLDGG